jgi:hypothetical protein
LMRSTSTSCAGGKNRPAILLRRFNNFRRAIGVAYLFGRDQVEEPA